MPERAWSRRDVLRQCLAAGVLVVPAGWGEAEALHAWLDAQRKRQPTAHVEITGKPEASIAAVEFELVLGKA